MRGYVTVSAAWLLLLTGCSAQLVTTCDKTAVTGFDAAQYLGTWFEIARFGVAAFQENSRCVTAEYSLAADNNVTVLNTMYNATAGAFEDIVGWASLDDPTTGEAKLTVNFPEVPVPAPYWVLATDYVTYSIVWSCREPTEADTNITETSWILSRNSTLTAEQAATVDALLDTLELPRARYTDTEQDPAQCSGAAGAASALAALLLSALAALRL